MNWCFSLTFLVFLCVYQTLGAEEDFCPEGQYYVKETSTCHNCTKCPKNLIIRRDCTNLSNTVCGHFKEFDHFRNEIPFDAQEEITVVEDTPDVLDILPNNNPPIIKDVPTTSSEDKYWKNLAFALIGVLCVLIIAATMVVWYACRKLHASVQIKRPDYDDTDDPDNGYVVIRSIRHTAQPPSNQSLSQSRINNTNYQLLQQQQRLIRPYRPKRRLLNEYADDVFESDDSGGSRASRRILCSIPEQNDESTSPRESLTSPEKQPMV